MRSYLERLRSNKNLSKVEAAKDVGVSSTYYIYIESGDRQKDMTYSMMEKLAKAFNVPIQKIVESEMEYRELKSKAASHERGSGEVCAYVSSIEDAATS